MGIRFSPRTSFGPPLGALGLRLLIVVDEEAMARLAARPTPKHPSVVPREARMRAGVRGLNEHRRSNTKPKRAEVRRMVEAAVVEKLGSPSVIPRP